jgi:molybdopterin-guanine dinucleotide biosynthesis protein A
VQKDQCVVPRHPRPGIELPRSHRLALDDRSAMSRGDFARAVVTGAIRKDHLVRTGSERGIDRRADGGLLVACGDDDGNRSAQRPDGNLAPVVKCYILTGGRSTRMRQSKTGLFFDRVAAAALPVFDEVVAVQRSGDEELVVRTIYERPHADEGPIFGVARALEDANAPAVIMAVDYPGITSDILRDLASRFEATPAAMLVPMWRGVAQPLCAGYRPSVLPLIESRLEQRSCSMDGNF